MTFHHRFFIYGPFALFVALFVGLSVHWWMLAGDFGHRLDARNGHEIMPGVTLHFASKRIGGFPFRLDAVFTNFELDIDTPHGPVRWRTPGFATHSLTYGRAQTILEATGTQRLDWTGLDGKTRGFTFIPGAIHASAIEDDGGLARFDLDIVAIGSSAFLADRAQFHFRRDPARDGFDVFVEAGGVRVAPRLRFVFGDDVRLIQLSGTLAPGKPFDGVRAGHARWDAAVDAWRGANGALHVDGAEIKVASFDAMGKGTLGLDEVRRPSGILDFKLAGFSRFVAQRNSRGGQGAGAAIADALLSRAAKAGNDENGEMGVVIGVKDGIGYVGDQPVGTMGPLY